MIRKAVELEPTDGYIINSLGWVLFRLGRQDEAVVQLERAVEIRPEDAAINDHLGDAYWAVGRQREARFQWEAALSSGPDPDLKAAIDRWRSGRYGRRAPSVRDAARCEPPRRRACRGEGQSLPARRWPPAPTATTCWTPWWCSPTQAT